MQASKPDSVCSIECEFFETCGSTIYATDLNRLMSALERYSWAFDPESSIAVCPHCRKDM